MIIKIITDNKLKNILYKNIKYIFFNFITEIKNILCILLIKTIFFIINNNIYQ
jgi:hypothetical protein